MKLVLMILAALSMTGCKTYNITFQEVKAKPTTDTVYVTETAYIYRNRFTKQFHEADSVFRIIQKASNEAAKSALESTKHLIPF